MFFLYYIFRENMKQLLNRNIEHLNFSNDPVQCREHINQFIANATHNQYGNGYTGNGCYNRRYTAAFC